MSAEKLAYRIKASAGGGKGGVEVKPKVLRATENQAHAQNRLLG
jgi:glutamate dehydrogenase/leucine dehydrogenase